MAGESGAALVFYLNGKKVVEECPDPEITLIRYIRDKLLMRGSKIACEEGGCGSCTVMISKYDRAKKKIVHKPVVSCILPLCQVHGCSVTTIEGLGNTTTGLHEIQKRLVDAFGIQCGFCTPGMIMSCYALLRNNPKPTAEDIEYALEGNLCRCTGYRPILKAFKTFTDDFKCSLGEDCCRNGVPVKDKDKDEDKKNDTEYQPFDPTQEPIFPSELQVSDQYDNDVIFKGSRVTWIMPVTLDAILASLRKHPAATLVSGYTQEIFLQRKANNLQQQVIISLSHVEELRPFDKCRDEVSLGASLTISECMKVLGTTRTEIHESAAGGIIAVHKTMGKIGSEQVRNMMTIGGSLFSNKGNSDVILALLAAGASVNVHDFEGRTEKVPLEDWINGGIFQPRKDIIVSRINIPFSRKGTYVLCEKQSWRRAFDGSVVNAGLNIVVDSDQTQVKKASLYFGGLKNNIFKAESASSMMSKRALDASLIEDLCAQLSEEILNSPGMKVTDYKRTLALSIAFKFLSNLNVMEGGTDPKRLISSLDKGTVEGTQVWEEKPPSDKSYETIGRAHPDVASRQKATGEALFYSDLPSRRDELFLALVQSTKAHAKIVAVDVSSALEMEGVHGYVSSEDVPGSNITGFFGDEKIFATDVVETMGEVIGGIVAETEVQARRAAKAVNITYEELPVITTIEEAIEKESFEEYTDNKVSKGDAVKALAEAEHVLEGFSRIGNQEHFYMETQFSLVVPSDGTSEYNVFAGAQSPAVCQEALAKALNIPCHKIIIHQKRMGGAFGGKHTRPLNLLLLPAAVAAHKFRRPVRCQLTREQDISITGGRHSYLIKHKVGYTNEGKLTASSFDVFLNSGSVMDQSSWVGEYTMMHMDFAYKTPHYLAQMYLCKTNTPSPTAFRGYGKPQGVFAVENFITDLAETLGMLPETVRSLNFYEEGDIPPVRKTLENCTLRKCWDQLMEQAQVEKRRKDIQEFNKKNPWRKRGICIVPTTFSHGFPMEELNQGGALVQVYKDGSVMLAIGDSEMGQGINTKMIQIASQELQVPPENIHIMETSTSTIPNATFTAASIGSELNGGAVIDACKKIWSRLEPHRKVNPTGSWKDWVESAYCGRVSLSATGHYKTNTQFFDPVSGNGRTGVYSSYGAACSEVEIDCLTGQHVILRADVIHDVGQSLNPGIDVGQIEGGFIQGVGLYTIEEMAYSPDGKMLTCNTSSYKIPTVADIPRKINVTLLKGASDMKTVYSSKCIGEPSITGAVSVFFAIKDAIKAARADAGLSGIFRLDSPATPERIRMACPNRLLKLVTQSEEPPIPAWRY